MLSKYPMTFALSVLVLGAQSANAPTFGVEEFRKAVQDGLPPDPKDRAMFFALGHEEVAVPILVAEIKAKLNDPDADYFIKKAADLAIYIPNQRAVDVVADLCQIDKQRFSWLVPHLLNRALGYQREFELAYYAAERYPDLLDPVTDWFKDTVKDSMMDVRLARELLKREKAGHLIRADDVLVSRLPAQARERVYRAVERARLDGRDHHVQQ